MIKFLKILFITGLGTGYLPVAPATFSCLLSIVLWYLLHNYPYLYWAVFVVLFLWGLIINQEFIKEWGNDPPQIVIDEYACFLLPLYFVPKKIIPLAIVFVFFRIFDVLKPPPLRKLERLSGTWGIMLDDLGAATYTSILYIVLNYFLHF